MRTPMLGADDHARIAAAIRAAEANTSGEIFCVLAGASDGYFHHAAVTLALAVLAAGLGVAFALDRSWLTLSHTVFVAAELAALALALLLVRLAPALRIFLVPRSIRYRRAHDNAVRQFLARNVHRTAARTGVLIFVSLAERYAEVVADAGIAAKVPQERWNGLVAALTDSARDGRLADGFVAAVGAAGALLAAHFPPLPRDPNELDDHVVEI